MRIIYIGTGDIGLPALGWLLDSGHEMAAVFTQPDKPAGRKMELLPSPIKRLALERGVPIYQPEKMRAAEAVEQARGLEADLIVVMAYGQILPKGVLEAGRIACLNVHASILPRHRGAAPIQSAILAGDAEAGLTVMYMDEGLDTGDVLLIRRVHIGRHETGGTLHDRLAEAAPGALAEAMGLLEAGKAPRVPQDSALATYAKKLGREEGEIRWELSCGEIGRHIRAMNPWPGAFTWLAEKDGTLRKIKVFCAGENRRRSGMPGSVIEAGARGILVGCGTGTVLLREIQMEGKRRMSARDFLIGRPISPGTMLGVANGNGR
ncbi:MAG: methionyl-tRNA formyltransferase [Chthoniobacteraceae bacterium]|jgi:methionyl-tRNA formyltransferase